MGATWFNGVTLTCEIAFGDAPKAASPTWTDVSAYVRVDPPIVIERGNFSTLNGDFSPGTMTLHLDNRDRRFDPDYSSSPYFGDLVPMVKIRLLATLSATTKTLFTGYVMGWTQRWTKGGDGTVEVSCVDGSRFVQGAQLASSAWAWEVESDANVLHYWPLQSTVDLHPDRVGSVALSRTHIGTVSTADIGAPIGESNGVVLGQYDAGWQATSTPSTAPRGMDFWVYGETPTTELVARVGQYDNLSVLIEGGRITDLRFSHDSDANSYTITSSDTPVSLPLRPARANHVAVYSTGTTMVVRVNGSTILADTLDVGAADWGTNDPQVTVLQSDTGVSHWALYSDVPGTVSSDTYHAAGIAAHGHPYGERGGDRIDRVLDEINWPAGQRSIDTGDTEQGPYLPAGLIMLEYARQVVNSEQGALFFNVDGDITFLSRNSLWVAAASAPTFSDDGAAGAVRYTEIQPAPQHVDNISNIVTTSYSNVGAITRRDQTSIDAYGEGRRFIDGPTIPDARSASMLSAYVLRESKDPSVYIERIECLMRTSDGLNEFATLAGVELADIVNVEHTPNGVGSQVVRSVQVVGITHEIGAAQWRVMLSTSKASSQADDVPYFVVGDAQLGKLGATADNRIPF